MKDMMEQKNKLAYDNGRLQTEVQELRGQVDILKISSTDAEQLRAKNSSLQSRYDLVRFLKIIMLICNKTCIMIVFCVETNLFKMKDIKLWIKSCLVHSILYLAFQNNAFSNSSQS